MNRWHSPSAELYALVEQTPATVLFECANPAILEAEANPFTRLFTAPLRICTASQFSEIPNLFAEIETAVAAGLYVAGYFTYECGAFFEPTADPRLNQPDHSLAQPLAQPLAWFGIYDRAFRFDHRTGAFFEGIPPGLGQFLHATEAPQASEGILPACTLALAESEYNQRIAAIHEWIRSGDVYQLNFAIPLEVHAPGSPAALYRRLRRRQPVPYGAFLHCRPNHRILSFSPELFFRLESPSLDGGQHARRIVTRPMKGTAPRGRTTAEDRAQAEWLRNDPKNRAENVMIVDLLRNDLGRICEFGSVRAEKLFAVERHPTLWQMTSTVTGELRPEAGFRDIFRALFPCGSITGAPKVRAMQLISQIERQSRGVYTGAIGFFSKEKTAINVAIRTLSLDGDRGAMSVGSGIVIDSNAAQEFRECLLKAEFLTRPSTRLPDRFQLIETMLWQGGFAFLDLHLDRLGDSAGYFGFPCHRAEVEALLRAHAGTFLDHEPRKIRLLLDHDGEVRISWELLADSVAAGRANPLRVRIAARRTDPNDPMFFHKTTHRPLYAEALKSANQAGFDDALFLNLRGEVTEGARHNIFVEKDGRLFTPPIECGLLPGVQRRHILESHPDATERLLYLEDLCKADAIYLSNAVRGIRPAAIDWES